MMKSVNLCIGLVKKSKSFRVKYFSTTDFGFQQVNKDEKESLVRNVFSKVANKYDVMNDFMSVGIHRLWKDDYVNMMGIKALSPLNLEHPPRHLDVAGGTGDIAFRSIDHLVETFKPYIQSNIYAKDPVADDLRQVVVCDINTEMLSVGRDRAKQILGSDKSKMVGFVEGNAEHLPFPDASFDYYTIAFGLRNVTNKDNALQDAYRVLKPGGKLMILEFSHLENPLMQKLYDEYSFNIIPKMGEIVANDAPSYQYLVESIRKFPKQEDLCHMIRNAGFKSVSYKNLTFGVVAIHSGFKL